MSDGHGYLGRAPGDSATLIVRQNFAGNGGGVFTFSAGYDPGFVEVYKDGKRLLEGSDFGAGDGSTVTTEATVGSGSTLAVIAYKAFNIANPISNLTGDTTVQNDGKFTVTGITSLADVVSSGIVTADAFYGSGANLTNISSATAIPGINTAGFSTFKQVAFSGVTTVTDTTASTSTSTGALIVSGGVGIGKSLFIGEGVSVAGTITYNDVTNVDSVGVVTAGKGFRATTGGLIVTAGVSTFGADLVGKDGVQGIIVGTGLSVAGVVTATSFTGSGANLTGISTAAVPGINTERHSVFNTVNISGIATALEFRGDGSQLTGVGGETDITSCLFI